MSWILQVTGTPGGRPRDAGWIAAVAVTESGAPLVATTGERDQALRFASGHAALRLFAEAVKRTGWSVVAVSLGEEASGDG